MNKYKFHHLLLIITSVLLSGVGLLWIFAHVIPDPYPNATFYIFLITYFTMLISTAMIFNTKNVFMIHKYIGFQSTTMKSMFISILIAFLIWGSDNLYQTLILETDLKVKALTWHERNPYLMLVFFNTVIIVPIIEEMLFRGIILQTFNQYMNKYMSAILLSVAFALVHYDINQIPILILASLIYVWLTYKYNSIVPAIIAHIVNNCITFIYYYHIIGI